MRIAYVALSARGGTALYATGLAREISRRHDVLLVAPDHLETRPDFPVCPVRTGRTHLRAALRSLSPAGYARIWGALRRFRPDLIHFPLTHAWNAVVAGMMRSVPCVHTVHDPLPHEGARYTRWTSATHAYFYRRARAIVCLTDSCREQILNQARPRELVTIPHPCFSHYRAMLAGRTIVPSKVVFFGRIEEYKGIEFFVRAAALCRRQFPHAEFVVAGQGGRDLLARCGAALESTVVLNRELSEPEVAGLLASAIVVVLPYISSSQSGVVAAAYALGSPVIATRVGGLAEMVSDGETGLLVAPASVDDLAGAITRVLSDPPYAARLRAAVASHAAHELSWERVGREHEALYARCA